MIETCVRQLSIFYLQEDEFENAELKNKCLLQAKTDYIAYVKDGTVQGSDILQVYEDVIEQGRNPAAVICPGRKTEKIEYGEVFEVISAPIVSILFPAKLIHVTGAFNERLSAQTNFELLCRIARQAGKCELVGIDGAIPDLLPQEEWAETYAYIIRHHMQDLHTLKWMEHVFNLFCDFVRSKGIFPAFQRQIDLFLGDQKAYERIARQTAPFVVLRGNDTCMGVLQQFADDLYGALADEAQAVIMVNDQFDEYEKLQNMVCKGVVGFQAAALEIDFFRRMRGPKFQFWFDYPLHFNKVLRNLPLEYWILCQDANHAALVRKYYHTVNAIQFPPGGKVQADSDQERTYDIVFVGSCFDDTDELQTEEECSFYDYMLTHPSMTFERGLEDLLIQRGENLKDAPFAERMISLKAARRKVIGHFRQTVISVILEAGYTLHVYGDDWKNYQGAGREHLVIHPRVTVEESLEELAKAKIGLNIMSWYKAGMTERIANIMLSGAVCLTEETGYLREHMIDGEEIVCFGLDRLPELPTVIGRLLDNPEERERIAGNARRKALAEHTWKCRARQLIALADEEKRFDIRIRQGKSRLSGGMRGSMTERKRLVLFRGELDTLNLFSRQLEQGFSELGYDIFIFDLRQSAKNLGLLYQYMQERPVTAMIAFNSRFYGMTLPSGENVWEVLGIPCINIFVDHPYWYHDILMRMPATGIVLCIDRNHMDYVNRFYPDISSNGFIAHGGTASYSVHKPISERKTEVLYAGSLFADSIPQNSGFSAWDFPAEEICDRSIAYLLSHPKDTVEAVIEQQLGQAGISLADEALRRFISSCVSVERAASSRYRERIVGSIARSGISLELYGDGWEKCDWIGLPNVHYGGRVAPEKILAMMEDSKIVLNTFPWFKDGSHERIFNAMLCGAVAVSETNRYLEETLPPDAWVSYDLSEESLSALPHRVVELLTDENRMQRIAFAGRETAASAHTWKARAWELHEDLLSFL